MIVGTSKVDVLVPTYQRPGYLRRTIQSVLDQTLQEWRMVVSEDGPPSTEISEIVASFDDERITYRATGSHVRAPGNMTQLLALGTAPYAAFLHDDDLWAPEYLRRQVEFLDAHPECGFVFCANHEIDENGALTRSSKFVLTEGVHSSSEFVAKTLPNNLVGMPTVLLRRSAVDAVGGEFDESLAKIFDFDMWVRLGARFPVGYRRSRDAFYRMHGAQMTFDRHQKSGEHLRLLDKARAYAASSSPPFVIDEKLIRRERAKWSLSAALDNVIHGNRAAALKAVGTAVRSSPSASIDIKLPTALVGIIAGPRYAHSVGRMRPWIHRGRLRLSTRIALTKRRLGRR